MSKAPARTVPKKPRTAAKSSLRGFFNVAPALPDPGIVPQKDAVYITGGKGLPYGEGNTVPVLAMSAAQASGTAFRCLERRAQFLEGTGFPTPVVDKATGLPKPGEEDTLGDTPIPGHHGLKTANDLWAELCSYGSYNNGAAVLVRYSEDGEIGEEYMVPFASVRKTDKGTFLLNHKFGRKGFSKSDTTEHLPFDPSEETVKAVLARAQEPIDERKPEGPKRGQPGQIAFIYTPSAGQEDYPLPPHWAGLEDVLAEMNTRPHLPNKAEAKALRQVRAHQQRHR